MKKTINVNLAGRIFYVEDDAYPVLDTYLKEVKSHFEKFEDSEEILKDIETRIAEQLTPEDKNTEAIVSLEAVQKVIASMGNPKDFTETEDGLPKKATAQTQGTKANRRFYRNTDDAIIAGVSSGIASYFDIDPLWIRLAFAILTLTSGGFFILLYIVLWIAIPAAETPTQKLEMKGDKLTLKAIEQSVKENLPDKKHANKLGSFIQEVAKALGRFVKRFGGIFLRIIGIILTIAITIAIVSLIVATTVALFSGTSPYVDFPLREFFGNSQIYAALLLGFVVACIPLILLLLAGLSLASLRSKFRTLPTIALISIWVLAAGAAAGFAARNAPRIEEFVDTHPSFKVETTTQEVPAFSKISVENDIYVTLQQGQGYNVATEAVARDRSKLETKVEDGTLHIRKTNDSHLRWCILCPGKRPHITITAPVPSYIEASNAVNIDSEKLTTAELTVVLENGSSANLDVAATAIKLEGRNAGRATLRGQTQSFTAIATNGSRIRAAGLFANSVNAESSNGSHISVYAEQELTARASNGSTIRYAGRPTKVQGNARQMDEEDTLEWSYVDPSTIEPAKLRPVPNPTPAAPESPVRPVPIEQ